MNFDKYYFTEEFYKDANIRTGYSNEYVEIFVNPSSIEIGLIMKNSSDNGVRIGVSKQNNVFAWTEDVLHSDMEKFLKNPFVLKLQYTRGHDTLWLGTGQKLSDWKKFSDKNLVNNFKKMMPLIKKIEMQSSPFEVLWEYK